MRILTSPEALRVSSSCSRHLRLATSEQSFENILLVDLSIAGHEMTTKSAYFEYVDPTRAMLQPGACTLAGFPTPKYGECCEGPKAASLEPLKLMLVDMEMVRDHDHAFYFPQFKGRHRQPVQAWVAI